MFETMTFADAMSDQAFWDKVFLDSLVCYSVDGSIKRADQAITARRGIYSRMNDQEDAARG